FNHGEREAVARCPECRQFFCRECITEHDDRVICAACLRKLGTVPLFQRRFLAWTIPFVQCVCGFFLAWFFFHLIGEALSSLPSAFHERTLSKSKWPDSE